MDEVDNFALEVASFAEWAQRGNSQGEWAAREALIHLTRLYLSALELPPPWSNGLVDQPDPERIGDEEIRSIRAACIRLPFDYYGAVFDPHFVPPGEPGVGSVVEDIVDIYRDVVTGMRAYRSGNRAQAVWEWAFHFQHHWGQHATGAIRALHFWLATNAFDRLSAEAKPTRST